MPNLTVSIPHQLTRAEAKTRIQSQIEQLEKQYGGQVGELDKRWEGDTMNFTLDVAGVTVSGKVNVEDTVVRLDIVLPWLLSAVAGTMKQQIEQEGQKLLSKRE